MILSCLDGGGWTAWRKCQPRSPNPLKNCYRPFCYRNRQFYCWRLDGLTEIWKEKKRRRSHWCILLWWDCRLDSNGQWWMSKLAGSCMRFLCYGVQLEKAQCIWEFELAQKLTFTLVQTPEVYSQAKMSCPGVTVEGYVCNESPRSNSQRSPEGLYKLPLTQGHTRRCGEYQCDGIMKFGRTMMSPIPGRR